MNRQQSIDITAPVSVGCVKSAENQTVLHQHNSPTLTHLWESSDKCRICEQTTQIRFKTTEIKQLSPPHVELHLRESEIRLSITTLL